MSAAPDPVRQEALQVVEGGNEAGTLDVGAGERDDSRRLALLVLLRVLVASALFGAALSVLSTSAQEVAIRNRLYGFLIAAYATAALEFIWLLLDWELTALAWSHLAVETVLAGWLVALTGGPTGPFSFLVLLSTVHGALAAGSVGALASALLATAALGGLAEFPGFQAWLGTVPAAVETGRLAAAVLANAGGCFATAALSSYLTERLQRTGRALTARVAELRSLGDLYSRVVQSLGSGLLTLASVDGAWRVSLLNEAGARILGLRPEAARGRSLDDVAPALARSVASLPAGIRDGSCELSHGGGKILLEFAVSSLRGPGGETLGTIVTFEDVTELRRLEASVQRQAHLASLGELSAGLAHEIRNPLASLSGAVQMLSTAAASGDDARLLDLIRRESGHLGKLVSDFLVFARPPRPSLQAGDLGAFVRDCCEAFEPEARAKGRTLRCDAAPAPCRFDPDQMRQVVGNLLRNALEATASGGHIEVSLGPSDRGWRLAVGDDGPGVSPEIAPRLFEPFFTTKEKGTGLGLALVARIAGAHGGTVDLDQQPGRGACFVVTLPRAAI